MDRGQPVRAGGDALLRLCVTAGLALMLGCGPEVKAPAADVGGGGGVDTGGDVDAGEFIDVASPDTGEDTGASQGAAGTPCKAATDCNSALCLQTLDGGRCSAYCGDGQCLPGWSCLGQSGGGDGTYFCIPDAGLLCRPCESHEACRASGHATAACVDYGDVGAFCGLGCQSDSGCPSGSACRDVKGIDGGPVKQCVVRIHPTRAKRIYPGLHGSAMAFLATTQA